MDNSVVKIAIVGVAGKMGRMLVEAATLEPSIELCAAIERVDHPMLGHSVNELFSSAQPVPITADLENGLKNCHCLIDFTQPQASLANLQLCLKLGKAMVIGTTGFTSEEKQQIYQASSQIPLVFAPNMAVGVNATFKLIEVAAEILKQGYDVEIIEAHHRFKVDAPSGTALRMGEIVAKARQLNLEEDGVFARQGHTGARSDNEIGFATIRGGDIVGDHTVMFCGLGERIEITHRSNSRYSYASGSMRAAIFLQHKKAGLYDMQDVLGLK